MKKPKFSIGDHVVVVGDFSPWFEVGETGTVVEVTEIGTIRVKVDNRWEGTNFVLPGTNLEHSELHNSPLHKALLS